jgi:hypothetical protein
MHSQSTALIPYRHGVNNKVDAQLHMLKVGLTDPTEAWMSDDPKTRSAGRWLLGFYTDAARNAPVYIQPRSNRRIPAYFGYIRPPGKYALSRLFYDIELNLSYATGH